VDVAVGAFIFIFTNNSGRFRQLVRKGVAARRDLAAGVWEGEFLDRMRRIRRIRRMGCLFAADDLNGVTTGNDRWRCRVVPSGWTGAASVCDGWSGVQAEVPDP